MLKIGVICPSEIALRRFMPALEKTKNIEFVGVGVYSIIERFGKSANKENKSQIDTISNEYQKATKFVEQYGGKIFNSYQSIIESKEIDAIYIPLPPALHYKWAKMALKNNKHVLIEKPSTTNNTDCKKLVKLAKKKNLALHENYMFVFHNQIKAVNEIIESKEIGDVRLYRVSFGFPRRLVNDFRYNKALGGGALIDAGGYTLKYASILLGEKSQLKFAKMNYCEGEEVDIYGSGVMCDKNGCTAQISYGMDNDYKCELEVWGSKGTLVTNRILTAPANYIPTVVIRKNNVEEVFDLPEDDSFYKSIQYFLECIGNTEVRRKSYQEIEKQSKLVACFRKLAKINN